MNFPDWPATRNPPSEANTSPQALLSQEQPVHLLPPAPSTANANAFRAAASFSLKRCVQIPVKPQDHAVLDKDTLSFLPGPAAGALNSMPQDPSSFLLAMA